MELLLLRPDSESYAQQEGNEVIGVTLDGGGGRYRRDKIGATRTVDVSWTMNPQQFKYWRAFWNTATKRGSLPFLCELVGEDGTGPQQYVCQFIPGSVQLPQQIGFTYVQSAQLEVKPPLANETLDSATMALYATGTPEQSLLDIGHLVNVVAPEALVW
jgi:hypothetical protein